MSITAVFTSLGFAGLLLVGSFGCRQSPSAESETTTSAISTSTMNGEESDSASSVIPNAFASRCEDAQFLLPGQWPGSFSYDAADELSTSCMNGGRGLFFQIDVPWTADLWIQAESPDFIPQIAVFPNNCLLFQELACLPGRVDITSLVQGTSLMVVIFTHEETIPLSNFTVEFGFLPILKLGDPCHPPSRGRCPTGSLCLLQAEEQWQCTLVEADSYQNPQVVTIEQPLTELELFFQTPQTDVHAHTCTGLGQRERAFLLQRLGDFSAASLEISSSHPDIGLAARSPGCLAEHEIACTAPFAGSLSIPAEISKDQAIYLFVELPENPLEPEASIPILIQASKD